ncbi:MAG: molybdopterin-dependent oxidoreductase, partial [Pseudomonadota bacterium]
MSNKVYPPSAAPEATREFRIKKANCMFCHSNCGMLVEVENGRITRVSGNPDHQVSRGNMCSKPTAAAEFHDHPDRVNYPLKRVGRRGEGKWERISWGRAMDEMAEKLTRLKEDFGAETLAIGRGTYRTYYWPLVRFQHLFGTPNLYSPGQICFCNTWSTHVATYGAFAAARSAMHHPKAGCVVLWGFNPRESYPVVWRALLDLKKKGAKLITVDPRRTPAAEAADIWLQLRPQSDGAMILAWLNVIINEELYDKAFVEQWTHGFDQLKERVQAYAPEKVSEICWVPAEKIRAAARMYVSEGRALMPCGVKLDQLGRNQTQAIRAQCILRAITGNLDVEGGEPFGTSGEITKAIDDNEMELHDAISREQKLKQIGVDRFKLFTWPGFEMLCKSSEGIPYASPPPVNESCMAHEPSVWRTMLTGKPYPVKALIIQGNNPLLQATNTRLVYNALKTLDLIAIHEYFMTPTAMLADYVFPAADWLERVVVAPIAGMRNFINA